MMVVVNHPKTAIPSLLLTAVGKSETDEAKAEKCQSGGFRHGLHLPLAGESGRGKHQAICRRIEDLKLSKKAIPARLYLPVWVVDAKYEILLLARQQFPCNLAVKDRFVFLVPEVKRVPGWNARQTT